MLFPPTFCAVIAIATLLAGIPSVNGFSTNGGFSYATPSLTTTTNTKERPSTELQAGFLAGVDTFYKTAPYAAAFLTCGFKASMADLVAQKKQRSDEGKKQAAGDDVASPKTSSFLPQRNVAFLLYGGLYQGCAQEFIYNRLFPRLFGKAMLCRKALFKTVLFDQIVVAPLLCLPIAYIVKSIIFRYSFKEGIGHYVDDVKNHGLLDKYWMLWTPVQCISFGLVPQHYRISFMAFVSFFWLIILSSIATRNRDGDTDEGCLLADGLTCELEG